MPLPLTIRPLTRRIGAEIFGLDLALALAPEDVAAVQAALAAHKVVFFRDQQLSPAGLVELGRRFGDLVLHSAVAGLADHPEVVAIHADADSTFVAGEDWHSDLSEHAAPPMGSILYMHTLPETGGDTLFACMEAAYDALSPAMQAFLDPLTALHDANPVYREIFPLVEKTYPKHTHPVVRRHPVTGRKGIFVNASKTTRIHELAKGESDALLAFLFDHVKNPNFQTRFRWQQGSVAFWDNRCTQHFAVWDYFPDVRSGWRVTIAGEAPC
ncbi:MAG TPA: TauD/TfdA family dioxygenase [Novosphingobium sp.]|nr:TauD/TfdA family dioxygenase [Novosphingobium sp.]